MSAGQEPPENEKINTDKSEIMNNRVTENSNTQLTTNDTLTNVVSSNQQVEMEMDSLTPKINPNKRPAESNNNDSRKVHRMALGKWLLKTTCSLRDNIIDITLSGKNRINITKKALKQLIIY